MEKTGVKDFLTESGGRRPPALRRSYKLARPEVALTSSIYILGNDWSLQQTGPLGSGTGAAERPLVFLDFDQF